MHFLLRSISPRMQTRMPVWNTVIWIWEIRTWRRTSWWEVRSWQSCVRECMLWTSWRSPPLFWPVLPRKVREIIWFLPEIIPASSTLCPRHPSSSSRSWWLPVLTVISRSLPASVMRMREQTVLPESFISWIWRWPSLLRKMYSPS